MISRIASIVIALSISTVVLGASSDPETDTCEYMNLEKDVLIDGLCHMEVSEINDHFAYILTWPSGYEVTVEYVDSQSGHHLWKLNGKSAVGIEINRGHLRGFSLDLNQFLEWR